jgi:histidinol-phosphate aminotransferase
MAKELNKLIRLEVNSISHEEYAHEVSRDIKANLSLNINPLGPSSKCLARLQTLNVDSIKNYYATNIDLIKRIAKEHNVGANNVLLCDGCDGGLNLIAQTFIGPSSTIAIPIPTFHRYAFHTQLMGGNIKFIQLENFEFSAKDLFEQIKDCTIIFLASPSNPTGLRIKKEELLVLCNSFSGLIIIDEALCNDGDDSFAHLVHDFENTVIVRSFSKIYGLASLRIGYILACESVISAISQVTSPYTVNGVAQELALIALDDKEHIYVTQTFIKEELRKMFQLCTKLNLVYTESITTNFLLDCSSFAKSSKQAVTIFKEHHVDVTDATIFKTGLDCMVRVSLGTTTENEYFRTVLQSLIQLPKTS